MDWIKNHKNIIFNILLFFLIFIVALVFSHMFIPIVCDRIWSYGFSYNISKGLIIYKDFNVVQMPLYFMVASLFIKIFGNYMIAANIFDSILIAIISFIIIKRIGWKGIFPCLSLLVFVPSQYNILCLLFLFLIINLLSKEKYNNYIIALLVGLAFITKQNIGVYLFIPMFFYSKHKIKDTIIFILPFLLLCLYFLFNNALFEFIDYTILGLFEFSGNKDIDIMFLICIFLCIGYLIYNLLKSNFKDKECFYILIFQLVVYPLCDLGHFFLAFIPFLYYFLKNVKNKHKKVIICLLECFYILLAFIGNFLQFDIHTKKDLMYLKSPSSLVEYLNIIYNKFDGDIKNVYFDSEYSYLLKMYYDIPISELDFFLDGNLGHYSKDKSYKYLKDHCRKEKCIFLLYKKVDPASQFVLFDSYVKDNYKKIDEFDNMDVYSSK